MKCRARTADDVEKAYRSGESAGIHKSVEALLMVSLLYMADKCGWRERRLMRFHDFFMQYVEEISKGNITGSDLREILDKEYNVKVRMW